jgi:hypothetical protein
MGFDDIWPLDTYVIEKDVAVQLSGDGFWVMHDPSTGEVIARKPVDFKLFRAQAKV